MNILVHNHWRYSYYRIEF